VALDFGQCGKPVAVRQRAPRQDQRCCPSAFAEEALADGAIGRNAGFSGIWRDRLSGMLVIRDGANSGFIFHRNRHDLGLNAPPPPLCGAASASPSVRFWSARVNEGLAVASPKSPIERPVS